VRASRRPVGSAGLGSIAAAVLLYAPGPVAVVRQLARNS